MKKRINPLGYFALLACLFVVGFVDVAPSFAKEEAPEITSQNARQILRRLDEGVKRFTLSNGLRVVLFQRPQAPVFAGQIWVKVGGVNEVVGTTGVAHLLEHMAFKGSKTVGTKDYEEEVELLEKLEVLMDEVEAGSTREGLKEELGELQGKLEKLWVNNEFSQIYQTRGAVGLNAGTSKDYTVYLVSLPSVAFDLWCWMESDRIKNPVFRQFYKERNVVIEERRMRTDDNPGGKLYETLLATAYHSHPNRLPVIGWRSDIEKLRTKDIQDFYDQYYRPDNMVIGLVGDLDADEVKEKLELYFGGIPSPTTPLPKVRTVEPPQEGERKATVLFDAEPSFAMAFHKPVYPNKDDLQFAVLHSILSDGRSSLLYKELVQKRQIATSVSTSEAPGELFPSLFYVWAVPAKGVSNAELAEEVQKILDSMKVSKVSEADLSAAKKRVRVELLSAMGSNYGLARTLARSELLWGNWEVIFEMYDEILGTQAEDLQRLAKTYFRKENRTLVFREKK